ncbi:hypothetical protein M2283_007019 [Streptomyces pseudovenezuelae]|uniref:CBM-cenC domain-containing protein n=1 Tax=Streptomyces pseudovenezuelae TaxID=67350 RepID=A0ABT6LTN9_9ACTN|nr:hypothetical protein [Streptomyces pseudovenezuelae]
MPPPPTSHSPNDRPALEPIRVLRPRRTDALAQLLEDIRQDKDYRSHEAIAAPLPHTPTGDETQELPPVPDAKTEQLPAPHGDTRPPHPADRPRLGSGQRRAAMVTAIVAAAVVGFGCSLLISSPTDATSTAPSPNTSATPTPAAPGAVGATDALANPGFESSSLSPWNCTGNPGSIVSSPVLTGSKALQGKVSSRDTAQCDQTVTVQPNTAYTFSGWVRGSNVYLGVDNGRSTWTTSPSGYSRLTVTFTTDASQTSATIYVHGWYAQGDYYADDITLTTSSDSKGT